MEFSRRDAIKKFAVGSAAAAAVGSTSLVTLSGVAHSEEPAPVAPKNAVGMLYDTTRCIGCQSCVVACAEANNLLPEAMKLGDGVHLTASDLNSFTKNIIKLYKPVDGKEYSFVKQQCMQCVDPTCVAGCMFKGLQKDKNTGVITWNSKVCVGCRYCEISCPFHIPKFQWQGFNPKIVKCELCKERLAKGDMPACTSVCPTHAVIFGKRDDLLIEAKTRIKNHPGKYHDDHVYGETEGGGTQVLYLSHVAFENLGLPKLESESVPRKYLKWQKRVYSYLAVPAVLYASMVGVINGNFKKHQEHMKEDEEENWFEGTVMNIERWDRCVPVFNVPLLTKPFKLICALGALALGLVTYRELSGLGPASGMNDAYAWGIWKTFNIMVLTGLGSGGFSIGIAAWIFRRHRLHVVMRTALLTSFLAYASGLMLLGVDVGRPWNFYWVFTPWRWNLHSPLLEVAVCMPTYAMFPLLMENVPPVLDWFHKHRPQFRPLIEKAEKVMYKFYPLVVGLAYILPAMHQSSLGALMLLGGNRVHGLWQTPLLPLLYVWAAAFMGFACVAGTLLFCSLVWDRPFDVDVLSEMNRITAWIIGSWMFVRLFDIVIEGKLLLAFQMNIYAGLFWIEMLFLGVAVVMLIDSAKYKDARLMFHAHLVAAVGGMLYRFNPTTLAFQPKPGAFYFPSAIELLISVGFVSLAVAAFVWAVKNLAILPAPNYSWQQMEAREEDARSGSALTPEYALTDSNILL